MWRNRLLKGKYRDATFHIVTHDVSGGRRVAVHEYPLCDVPYAEDLGQRARAFSIDCHVLGPDYMTARDALIEALEKPGPGTLVHPYLGTRRVQVLEYRLRESSTEGGMARFYIRLVQAGENVQPRAAADTRREVGERASAALDAARQSFAERFDVEGPQYVADEAAGLLGRMAAALDALARSLPALPDFASEFQHDLTAFSGSLASLIRQPASMAGGAVSLIGALAGLASRPRDALSLYRSLFGFGDDAAPVPLTTANRRRQAENQDAVIGLVRQAAVIEAARTASMMEFETVDDATAVRDELARALDARMEDAPDALYQALADLRAAFVRDIHARGTELAKIVRVTPPATAPVLVLAHSIYGNAAREQEIVTRNRIRHPGFVPGGETLEVLSDA